MVSEDGSPHGPKTFVLWNPPLTMGQSLKGALAPLAAVTADGKFNLKHMSHTEGRVRARMNKCAPAHAPRRKRARSKRGRSLPFRCVTSVRCSLKQSSCAASLLSSPGIDGDGCYCLLQGLLPLNQPTTSRLSSSAPAIQRVKPWCPLASPCGRRAKHEVLRAELQEAAQARGAGVKLSGNGGASALSGDAWLEEVRLGRRRRTVAGTAIAALEVTSILQ